MVFLCGDFAHYISYIGLCILYFVFFTLLHCIFVQCALHISAFSAVSLRIKIDLLPRPSLSSQAAHHNLRAKTYFIKIQIRRISRNICSEYMNTVHWTGIFKILKLTVVLNLTIGQIYGFNGSLGVWWGVGLKSIAN